MTTTHLTPARVCSLARATSSASRPGLSLRTFAGASGRNSHKPVSCGGTGCVLVSAAHFCHWHGVRLHADRPALFPPQLFEAADNDGCPAPARGVSCNDRHFVTRHGLASNRRQYERAGLHLSPLSGGVPLTNGALSCAAQSMDPRKGIDKAAWFDSTSAHLPSAVAVDRKRAGSCLRHIAARRALRLLAITADPRRADPGNPLAGAVSVLRRLPNWPVALRGGGHIAGMV